MHYINVLKLFEGKSFSSLEFQALCISVHFIDLLSQGKVTRYKPGPDGGEVALGHKSLKTRSETTEPEKTEFQKM